MTCFKEIRSLVESYSFPPPSRKRPSGRNVVPALATGVVTVLCAVTPSYRAQCITSAIYSSGSSNAGMDGTRAATDQLQQRWLYSASLITSSGCSSTDGTDNSTVAQIVRFGTVQYRTVSARFPRSAPVSSLIPFQILTSKGMVVSTRGEPIGYNSRAVFLRQSRAGKLRQSSIR